MQELNKDDPFYQLMQKSILHLHSDGMEDAIMQKIARAELYRKRVYKNTKISIAFLILTTVLGFVLHNSFAEINFNSISIFHQDTPLLFQILLVSVFLLLVDNLMKIFKKRNNPVTS